MTIQDKRINDEQPDSQSRRGRPQIGEPVQVRLGELLAQVDSYATRKGIKRAEAIRELVEAGLTASQKARSARSEHVWPDPDARPRY